MRRSTSLAGVAALAAFVAFFAVLALDVAWRVWVTRATFDGPADVALLIGLESARAVATLTVAALAVPLAARREEGCRALATALLFLALWYAKATTFGFPGYLQERLALWLVDAGVSRTVLLYVFGKPAWALAPAASAFLLFALRYPSAPEPARVRDVHATGRRGMLRDVALAGTDVRSLLHRAAAGILESGVLRPALVVPAGLAAALLLAFGGPLLRGVAWLLLAGGLGLAFAFLRTARVTHDGTIRRRIDRLAGAAGAAFVGIAAGGALGFVPGAALAHVALVLSSLAPLVAAFLLTRLLAPEPDAA